MVDTKREELAQQFFAQQDEAILEGLKDLVAMGRLHVEYYPVHLTTLHQDGEAKVVMEQKLRVMVPPHADCTTCKHQETRGIGYCNILQQCVPKNFYCATHSMRKVELEAQPYSED